ncbi:MAG: ACP S-malonyltransferase [Pseudomonadota bacterium]
MTTAVLICPGRGSYTRSELGTLTSQFGDADLLAAFDGHRAGLGQETLTALDTAPRFSAQRHTRGDNASALIYAAALGDRMALRDDIEIVAVTGNSMGWYSALACAGALAPMDGFVLANTMGTLMQETLVGGQVLYPHMAEDWRFDPSRKAELLALVDRIDNGPGQTLSLSIDLGGMLVLAGNEAGLVAFEAAVPRNAGYPLRLDNHAAFHSPLMVPIAEQAKAMLPQDPFGQPTIPLVDGRGAIWWPDASDTRSLWEYTLGHQVTQTYDFTHTIVTAAREFAPDVFILTGPGGGLGGAVAQALITARWRGMTCKADFQSLQSDRPVLVSMGRQDDRAKVV